VIRAGERDGFDLPLALSLSPSSNSRTKYENSDDELSIPRADSDFTSLARDALKPRRLSAMRRAPGRGAARRVARAPGFSCWNVSCF
jgi:hypothetical protein